MKQSNRVIAISAFLMLAISSTVMQTVADTAKPGVLITKEEQDQHIEKMKTMTAEEKARYRNEQYEILRKKAASIGYTMPDTPPWSEAEKTATEQQAKAEEPQKTTAKRNARANETPVDSRHMRQLEKYRKAAAEKRKAMHERLEKQRQSIQERIARLVEQNAVKPVPEQPRYTPPAYIPAPPPPAPAYPGYYMPPQRWAPDPYYPSYYY